MTQRREYGPNFFRKEERLHEIVGTGTKKLEEKAKLGQQIEADNKNGTPVRTAAEIEKMGFDMARAAARERSEKERAYRKAQMKKSGNQNKSDEDYF